jgi:hypothetical protein
MRNEDIMAHFKSLGVSWGMMKYPVVPVSAPEVSKPSSALPPGNSAASRPLSTQVPSPPNWTLSLDQARISLSTVHRIPVPAHTAEYGVLAEMTEPHVKIKEISRIVNLELWKRFSGVRRELICGKSADLELLHELGHSEEEILQRAHEVLNFHPSQNQAVKSSSYQGQSLF